MRRYKGSFDQSTGIGTAALNGVLPSKMSHFGDFSISVNGRQFNVPLLSHQEFATAFAHRSTPVYRKGGLRLSVDFGRRTWSIYFNRQAFRLTLAPRAGRAAVLVKVGGEPLYTARHEIRNHASKLNYTDPTFGLGDTRRY